MIIHKAILAAGLLLVGAGIQHHMDTPKVQRHGTDWVVRDIPIPACPDGSTRTVDIPERDEVDALAVSCVQHNPSTVLGTDSQGKLQD